ncbi:hypothetical protein IG631_06255 [Alternaria alternata]|nr:hypothetical protein IG631_06255 [Alternaria alternata]
MSAKTSGRVEFQGQVSAGSTAACSAVLRGSTNDGDAHMPSRLMGAGWAPTAVQTHAQLRRVCCCSTRCH